jgi:hypothetical protein
MPYEFEPRDLDEPRATRRRDPPEDELAEVFEQWLRESDDAVTREIGGETSQALYELAVDALESVSVDPVEATALPIAYPDRVTPNVGLFLSAAYNRSEEDVVVFDVELPVRPRRLGYRLPAEKTLVLDAPVHSTMCVDASGLVINRTEIDRYFGYSSDGVFVNCGSCLSLGFESARAFVDVGEVRGDSGPTAGHRGVALDGSAAGGQPTRLVGSELPTDVVSYLDELEADVTGGAEAIRGHFDDAEQRPCDRLVAELAARLPDDV